MKILSVVGARPNFMKIASIANAVIACNAEKGKSEIEHVIVHTGQHYDERMSKLFFDELGIPKPHYNLEVGAGSHAFQTSEIMRKIEPVFIDEKPDFVLVVGDVNSTISAALVASKLGLRIVHVEAGLRSFDRAMPEEINRVLTDAISDMLFITERSAEENLRKEGISPDKIHFVGNVMIDTLLNHIEKAKASRILEGLGISRKGYVVLTLHRPSNVDDPVVLAGIIEALNSLSEKMPVIFPMHPRTRKKVEEARIRVSEGIKIIEPLGYLDFLKLVSEAKIVLTDSGGIQEETTVLKVPCLTLRENTERPVTVTEGTNRLIGMDRKRIVQAALEIMESGDIAGRIPELWDGHAGKRIIEILRSC